MNRFFYSIITTVCFSVILYTLIGNFSMEAYQAAQEQGEAALNSFFENLFYKNFPTLGLSWVFLTIATWFRLGNARMDKKLTALMLIVPPILIFPFPVFLCFKK